MVNECKHPPRSREYYRDGVFKCWECKKILTNHYPLSDDELKLIDDIDKTYKTGKYAPWFKRYKTEILSWIITIGGILEVSAFIYAMTVYKILLDTVLIIILTMCGLVLLYCFKMLVKMFVFNDYE